VLSSLALRGARHDARPAWPVLVESANAADAADAGGEIGVFYHRYRPTSIAA
jgi:hypothetical protein